MMLGYFPDPYPDELFYSLCARFSESMRYPTRDAPIRELLGLKGVGTLAILPTGLDQLVANLPPFACYTAEQFINEHTLYPYYAPFLPSDRLPRLQQVMRGDTSKPSPLVLVGMPSHRIPLRQWLRYCPVCAEEDRRSFGERYWHRLHQVTGVEVCPVHRVFLQNSSVQPYEAYRRYQIHSAEEAIQLTQPKTVDSFNTLHQKLLQIASDTAWLLDQHGLAFGLEGLRTRYRNRLYKEGLATYYGKLRLHQLVSRFRSHYPPELLAMVSSSFAESNHQNWLTTFLRGHSEGQPPHLASSGDELSRIYSRAVFFTSSRRSSLWKRTLAVSQSYLRVFSATCHPQIPPNNMP